MNVKHKCVQCGDFTHYSGAHPELFSICDKCRAGNKLQQDRQLGRPRSEIIHALHEKIPGSNLVAVDYDTQPPSWLCECGATCHFHLSQVQSLQRTTCSKCKACFFCKQRTLSRFKTLSLCATCKQQLLNWLNDSDAAGI